MKAIILARVSDEKQDSNEAQLNRISDIPKRFGIILWKVYEIEESSTKGNRKKFQEIIELIKQSKEPIMLIVDTVDRLQRSFKESVLLDELRKTHNLEIFFNRENLLINQNSNSSDLLRWDMAVMFARSYVLQLSDNVKRKFEQMRRNGEYTGRKPTGYIDVRNDDGHRINIILDPQTAHYVLKIFELYSTGNYSFRTLAIEITKLGLKNIDGKEIAPSTIEHIIRNPFYYGEMLCKGKLYPHKYEPIILKELYDRCQQVRLGWNKKPFKYAGKPYIFRGLLRCASCGCVMSPEIKKGKYVYYSCTNAKRICTRVYIPESVLLKPVYKVLNAFQSLPQATIDEIVAGLKQSSEAKNIYHTQATTGLQKEYNDLQAKIDKLVDHLVDGSITKDIYDRKLKEWKEKQYDINIQLEDHTRADESYHITASTVLSLAKRAADLFKSSDVQEKRAFLNYLFQNSRVEGKKLLFELRNPFNHILNLATQPTRLASSVSDNTIRYPTRVFQCFLSYHFDAPRNTYFLTNETNETVLNGSVTCLI